MKVSAISTVSHKPNFLNGLRAAAKKTCLVALSYVVPLCACLAVHYLFSSNSCTFSDLMIQARSILVTSGTWFAVDAVVFAELATSRRRNRGRSYLWAPIIIIVSCTICGGFAYSSEQFGNQPMNADRAFVLGCILIMASLIDCFVVEYQHQTSMLENGGVL